MARAIWKGFISFGLVSIPVGLHSAIESREELSFHLLHKKDLSRVDYKPYCQCNSLVRCPNDHGTWPGRVPGA
jgi:non-homologous end joining protein Ku